MSANATKFTELACACVTLVNLRHRSADLVSREEREEREDYQEGGAAA